MCLLWQLLIQCCRCMFAHDTFQQRACGHCEARSTKVAELEATLVQNAVTARGDVSMAAAMMQSWPDDVQAQYIVRIKKIKRNILLSSETGAVHRQPPLDPYCLLHGSDVFGTRYLMSVTAVDI